MLDGFGAVRDWLLNLVAIVMFSTFVELLLPESSISKHVKMVMGFIIVLFLIKPLVALDVPKLIEGSTLDKLDLLSHLESGESGKSTEDILSSGMVLAQDSAKSVTEDSIEIASKQFEATLGLLAGLQDVKVKLHTSTDGVVDSAMVSLRRPKNSHDDRQIENKVRLYISSSLDIPSDKVTIVVNEGE